jgi:hypothetical protein
MKQRLSFWMMSLLFGILPMTAANVTSDPSVLEFGKMWMEGGCRAQLAQRLYVEVTNIGDADYYGVWGAIDETKYSFDDWNSHPRCFVPDVRVAAGETKNIPIEFLFMREGHYKAAFTIPDQEEPLFRYEVDIDPYKDPGLKGSLRIDMLERTENGNILHSAILFEDNIYQVILSGTATLTNEGEFPVFNYGRSGDTSTCMYVKADPALQNIYYGMSSNVQILPDEIKSGETITVDFNLKLYGNLSDEIKEGREFYIEIGILNRPIVVEEFTLQKSTNTYWTADGRVNSLPMATDILKIPAEALAVDLRGQYQTRTNYSIDVSEANPNCLYYLDFLDNVPQGFTSEHNIVRGGEAKTLVVKADYDYFCPISFKAREAMFVYTPYSEAHGPAKSYMSYPFSGAIVLPFNAQKFWLSSLNENDSFYGENIKMLKYMGIKDNSLIFEPNVAGENAWLFDPYLISYVKPSPVTFYSKDIIVPVSDHVWFGDYEGIPYSFKGSYVETTASKGTYVWSNDKHGFYPCEEGTKIKPFTAVIVKKNPEDDDIVYFDEKGLRIFIRGENADPSGAEADDDPTTDIKALRSDKPQANEGGRLPVYSISGRRVTTVEASDGRMEGLKPGVYIIGGKKVVVR